jgi:hypothetical protein
MPRSSQIPDVPHPVPISTTARAPMAAAMNRSAAPVAGVTGSAPPVSTALTLVARSTSSSGRNSST